MGFTRTELQAYRDATVPDLVPRVLKLLFVGINPGLWTAAVQTHFARPGNRFYPALLEAGIVDRTIHPSAGMSDDDRDYFRGRGIGITNLVHRATARADELSRDELLAGRKALDAFVAEHRPAVVAVLGVTAYRTAFGRPRTTNGEQPERLHGARVWVVPNPSGLNAHDTVHSLAAAYAEPARAAGLLPASEPRPEWLA